LPYSLSRKKLAVAKGRLISAPPIVPAKKHHQLFVRKLLLKERHSQHHFPFEAILLNRRVLENITDAIPMQTLTI
jgi:hypothetical protein